MTSYRVLAAAGVWVVVTDDDAVPRIVHWGVPLAAASGTGAHLDEDALDALLAVAVPQGGLDVVPPLSLLPERSRGWAAYGGLDASRPDGTGWAPRFVRTGGEHAIHAGYEGTADAAAAGGVHTWHGRDADQGVAISLTIALDAHGVLVIGATVTNEGSTPLHLAALTPLLPIPHRADELLTLTGRWARELRPTRTRITTGAHVLENRRGRTSHESSPTLMAGPHGFAEEHGEVWAAHLAWSGDHAVRSEVLPDGRRFLALGELLAPGEVRLEPGATYAAPLVHAAYSPHGLNGISDAFHAHVRARPGHPRTPRPVILNTWEAVYFAHDVDQLRALADAAAAVGVERFVLDDGWFRGRNDDTTSLGDWYVDPAKYPDGLGPLVDHVTGLGMQFGLWVEPEMVSPDSDLFRAHPEWALGIDGQEPVLGRHQLVLDLARPEVSAYLLGRLDELLTTYDIAYLKWDMNRDLVAAGDAHGAPGTHAQTLALYALLDRLRLAHPGVEIESCASGGGRIDLGIAARTDRFWTSDCHDPLERQRIQRGFSYLLPPELMGAHVGGEWAHTTARRHWFPFRGATALFGHLGIEENLLYAGDEERRALAETVALHTRLRPLLHGGRVVRVDHPDASALVHGVVSPARDEALYCYAQLETSPRTAPAPVRLVGLDPARRYRVERLLLPGANWQPGKHAPDWYDVGLVADGALLGTLGVPLALHVPEQATIVHVTAL